MRPGLWLVCGMVAVAVAASQRLSAQVAQDPPPVSGEVSAAVPAPAATPSQFASLRPLSLAEEPESVYPQPSARQEDEGLNSGAVHFDLNFSYVTRYVYRGVDQTTPGHRAEIALQFDGQMEFDLGKIPHPFVGLFVNVFDKDPMSRFEEVRPYFGLRWTIKPITISGGYISYIFPNREKSRDTQEVFISGSLDDSRIWNTDKPVLSPYVFGAYDFDRYNGFYLETGIKHDFILGDSGVTVTPVGSIAYILQHRGFLDAMHRTDSGWQHAEVGFIGTYSLNQGINLPRRYGDWKLKGFVYYDDGLLTHVRADTRLWGGGGLSFEY